MAEIPHILIVDDEEDVRETLKSVLKSMNFEPYTAANGVEALEVIKNNQVDVVLSDLYMPEMDGIELLRRVRSQDKNMVFVMITAHPTIEIAVEANVTSNTQTHPNAPGSLGFTQTGAPTYGQGQHVSAALSSTVVNRAVYSAWDSGLLSYTIDQQFLARFGINLPFQISTLLPLIATIFPPLQAMGTPQDIGIQLAFDLPPSADFSAQSPNLRLAAGGMRVSLVLDFGAGYVPVLSLNMAGELGADVQTSAQSIQLSLQSPTQIRFDVTQNGNPLSLNLSNVNTFVNMAIGQAIQLLGAFIPAIPVPAIPAFQGVQVGVQSLDTTFDARFIVLDATLR